MPMKYPPHPGKHLRVNCLEASHMNVSSAASLMGVARGTLSRILNGRAGISPEMAIRLEKMGWGEADGWMRLQMNYDLAQARARADEIIVHSGSNASVRQSHMSA